MTISSTSTTFGKRRYKPMNFLLRNFHRTHQSEHFLSLPIYAELHLDQVEEVTAALDQAVLSAVSRLPSWRNDG